MPGIRLGGLNNEFYGFDDHIELASPLLQATSKAFARCQVNSCKHIDKKRMMSTLKPLYGHKESLHSTLL